ncbi:MAG TPA: glycosyltransferase family 39 protein [Casimicrobiaceae bacterium]|jgi:4-amino-4-deoxy-L-arabinose transferase-like glycosyltransferase
MVFPAVDSSLAEPRTLSTDQRWLVGLLLVAVLVRLATLAAYPLMDNTEARYAEVARKMLETADWVTPHHRYGVAFWSKPPLSIWLTAISYIVFGVNEFAARLASLLPCLGVAWIAYDLALSRDGRDAALRTAVVLLTTPLFFISAGAVMTDPALIFGTTLSMAGFWHAMTREDRSGRVWGYAFFLGLAIGLLAKGPVGVVLTLVPVGIWTLWKGGVGRVWKRLPWVSGIILTALLAVPWYLLAESRTPGFLDYFIIGEHWKRYTVSGWQGDMFGSAHAHPRGTIWLYALVSTLPWCVAWAVLAWRLRRKDAPRLVRAANDWHAYLWLWLLAAPMFFTPAGNILPTYVLPSLPAFALLVGEAWSRVVQAGREPAATRYNALVMPVVMVLAVLFALPRIAPAYSHKALVAEYLSRRQGPAQELVYLGAPPLSAEFYASGKIRSVASATELDALVRAGKSDFFVLTDAQLAATPVWRDLLAPIARSGRYQLLQPIAPAASRAP